MGRFKRKKKYNRGDSNTSMEGGASSSSSLRQSSSFLSVSSTSSVSSAGNNGEQEDESSYKNYTFNRKDRKIVRQYLQEYKCRALELYCDNDKTIQGRYKDDGVTTTSNGVNGSHDNIANAAKSSSHVTRRTKKTTKEGDVPMSMSYGGLTITFPLLTKNVLCQPYLSLPTGLTSNQRKFIHELCVDLNLFHYSLGEIQRQDRYIVISIFSDGLSHIIPDFTPPSKASSIPSSSLAVASISPRNIIELRQYHPWGVQRIPPNINYDTIFGSNEENDAAIANTSTLSSPPLDNGKDEEGKATITANGANTEVASTIRKRAEISRMAKQAIEALSDQPGECLRDGIDEIDFELLQDYDLSNIPKPGSFSDDGGNDNSEWLLVDTPAKMKQCIQELERAQPTELAFDVEAYNQSNYAQLTCLLQITSNQGKEYVIDTLAPGVWDEVNGLAPLFGNPNIVKVGHAIGGLDVRCLHRDFGIFVVNAFDTFEAATTLRLSPRGLANVCAHYGMPDYDHYMSLKSQYQNTDWRQRPLSKEMIEYGRYDIHYLLALRKVMMRDLAIELVKPDAAKDAEARQVATSLAAILSRFDEDDEGFFGGDHAFTGNGIGEDVPVQSDDDEEGFHDATAEEPGPRQSKFCARDLRMDASLMQVISQSQDRCLSLWSVEPEPHSKNTQILALMQKSRNGEIEELTYSQIELYSSLAQWRQYVAGKEGCLPAFICHLDVLALVAYKRPTTETGLRQVGYDLPDLFKSLGSGSYLDELFRLVIKSRRTDGLSISDDATFPSYMDFLDQRKKRRLEFASKAAVVSACIAVTAFTVLSLLKRRR